jgi:quercetin dioxygenase-like cupin family protein
MSECGRIGLSIAAAQLCGEYPVKIPTSAFAVTDWSQMPATAHPGSSGAAIWRTASIADLRVRVVEYTAGYVADHWCDRGHVLYVLEGELEVELRDGRNFKMKAGSSFLVSDFGDAAHRVATTSGARVFIVD